MKNGVKTCKSYRRYLLIVSVFGIFVLKKSFFELMQNKTEYCNSLVSKVLPTINKVSDNYFIFS